MITGGCLCGAVRYQAGGKPLFGLRCYCRDCQRASGSSNMPIMAVKTSEFKISGEVRSFAVTGESGNQAIRGFCPTCGSLLFGKPEAAPAVTTVYAGTFDDPSLFEASFQQFVRSRPGWEGANHMVEFQAAAPRPRAE
jgi:hypothetical protein